MMWFKVLNFLRMHEETGYYIRMILQVTSDMTVFMFVLLFTILGFADAMYTISRANKPNTEVVDVATHEIDPALFNYFNSYLDSIINSYLTALGDFSYGDFDSSSNGKISWVIFLLASILNCVVMLNLLIAVVSETFATVLSQKDENSFQEKAVIIAENVHLINASDLVLNMDPNDALIVAAPKE